MKGFAVFDPKGKMIWFTIGERARHAREKAEHKIGESWFHLRLDGYRVKPVQVNLVKNKS